MFTVTRVERKIGRHTFYIETGHYARQAAGAVMIGYADNRVLVAACSGKARADIGYFPLMMDYREKMYAAGKIPGGFRKREGMPGEKEVLTSRLMDRPIRPMFPEGYMDEVIVQAIVLSNDKEVDPDILAMNGGSAALCVSPVPFSTPVGSVRIGLVDGAFVVNPTHDEIKSGAMDLVISGTKTAITMVEAGMNELPEEKVIEAIFYAHGVIREICEMQEELMQKCNVAKQAFVAPARTAVYDEIVGKYYDKIKAANVVPGKMARQAALEKILEELTGEYAGEDQPETERVNLGPIFEEMEKKAVREQILKDGRRSDGRGLADIRPIAVEVGILPRVHGSATFTRGETQALATCTLGTGRDAQEVDGLRDKYDEPFSLHYNFPSFCVGEARPPRGPSRREIGHGALAKRALTPVLPAPEDFAYSVRIVSEVLESNGSSSQASICSGSLALMDAGVPIKKAVAGIAMGLVAEGGAVRVLSDILGSEDHCGDMDFKVGGTRDGITALQMDIKLEGLDPDIMKTALMQAHEGRMHILAEMDKAISAPRPELSEYAPRLLTFKIPESKIGAVIGTGGSTIRALQDEFKCTIEIEDDGTVLVASVGQEGEAAKLRILAIVEEAEVGRIYEGPVVGCKDFGMFVKILAEQEGMVHISELAPGYVAQVEDVARMGDVLRVKVINIDPSGKVKLSRKAVMLEEGESFSDGASGAHPLGKPEGERGDRGGRGDRGDRGGRDRDRQGGGGRPRRNNDRR